LSSNYPPGTTGADIDRNYQDVTEDQMEGARIKLFDSVNFQQNVITLICNILTDYQHFTPKTVEAYREFHEKAQEDIQNAYKEIQ
jgi:hypothetical protein